MTNQKPIANDDMIGGANPSKIAELDNLQAAYKSAVETWIASIRREEELASSADHSVAEIDQWEKAHFDEEDMRKAVKAAKAKYEDALRAKFFGF